MILRTHNPVFKVMTLNINDLERPLPVFDDWYTVQCTNRQKQVGVKTIGVPFVTDLPIQY